MQVAETSKPKKQPKVLDHLRISRALDGGHVIEHHYTSYQHEPKPYRFNKDGKSQGGQHIMDHLMHHAGLPGAPGQAADKAADMSEERAEGEDEEG